MAEMKDIDCVESEGDFTFMSNPVTRERERLARILRLRIQHIQKLCKEWLDYEKKTKDNPSFFEDEGGWHGWCVKSDELIDKIWNIELLDVYDLLDAVRYGKKLEMDK